MRLMTALWVLFASCSVPEADLSSSSAEINGFSGNEAWITLSAGSNNDLAVGNNVMARLTPHASGSTVSGIATTWAQLGWVIRVRNESATIPIVFTHLDTASASGARLRTPRGLPYVLGPQRMALIQYSHDEWAEVIGWELNAYGEQAGYASIGTTSRSLGSAFTPSTTRAVLGHWSVRVTCGLGLSCAGRVELLSDGSGTPSTVRARCGFGSSAAVASVGGFSECPITWLSNPGDQVEIRLVTEAGSPSGAINAVAEQLLWN